MASEKTLIIEYLFKKFWDEDSGSLSKAVMSLDDVANAIRHCNSELGTSLSDRNPANFLKDFLRGSSASKNWPQYVADRKFTAVQRTGGGDSFEFIPFLEGQSEAFPEDFPIRLDAPRFPIQSISIPIITKSLGRSDETWLIQTAINLKVVEAHFAIAPAFKLLELSHLQMGIKLRSTEIDAVFLGKFDNDGQVENALITCEAKQNKDPLIPSQIINQVKAAFESTKMDTVIPVGLRAIKNLGFYVAEFESVKRKNYKALDELSLASDAIYELHPSVKGV